jgi:hypothetical protein
MTDTQVSEAEMRRLARDNPTIVAAVHSKTQEPDVMAIDVQAGIRYRCTEPFDPFWWASSDPQDNTYLPPEQRIVYKP